MLRMRKPINLKMKKTQKMKIRYSALIIILALIQACSVEKFIPEDEFLYTGAEIKFETDSTITDQPKLEQNWRMF